MIVSSRTFYRFTLISVLTLGLLPAIAFAKKKPTPEDDHVDGPIPVLALCTQGKAITKDEQIIAHFKILDHSLNSGPIAETTCGSDLTGYERTKIKIRGSSSAAFAKKHYGLELVDENDKEREAGFLGMPAAEKWVLNAPYNDKSLMRDALAYRLGRKMLRDPYGAARTRYVEVLLNDEYLGIYVLLERISRGKERVDIQKIDLAGKKSPSFIAEVARKINAQKNPDVFITAAGTQMKFLYPSKKKIDEYLNAGYLVGHRIITAIEEMESALDPRRVAVSNHYRDLINLDSFVDYLIAQEFFKNIDGYRRSLYFYKGEGSSRVHLGPLWDFNLAMGNLNFRPYDMADTSGWVYNRDYMTLPTVNWFRSLLLHDPEFSDRIVARYLKLREPGNALDLNVIFAEIEELNREIGPSAAARNQKRWDGTENWLVRNIFRTHERSKEHDGNVEILRRWLARRLDWLDRHIDELLPCGR